MRLPSRLPHEPRLRLALGEFYDGAKCHAWFERAELVENHPSNLKNTLELYVKFNPVSEMNKIFQFAHKHDLALIIHDLSNNGSQP
jgi:hypothetical protein